MSRRIFKRAPGPRAGRGSDVGQGAGRLARRYRRLLLAYPGAYRRQRGAEMLGALLDAAPPGRTRPTVAEALDLLRGGLRARLGRPASRTVVTWALLVAMIWGVFSAAVATRVAWEIAAPMPSRAEAQAVVAEVLPGERFGEFVELDATLGDEYLLAAVRAQIAGVPAQPAPEMAETARRNLQAHGWTVYPTTDTCARQGCPPGSGLIIVAARRADTTVRLEINAEAWSQPPVSVTVQQVTPVAVHPAGVAGGVIGALVAFLVFGWASRRTQGNPSDGIERVMLGFALFLWWGPTVLAVTSMARHHVEQPHPSWHPMWEWVGQPMFSFAFVLGCVSAAVGLVACAVVGREETAREAASPTSVAGRGRPDRRPNSLAPLSPRGPSSRS